MPMGMEYFGLYWMLQELAAAEVAALQGVLAGPQEVRFHSCGVQNA